MITQDFKDYFTSVDSNTQQSVIDTLLSLCTESETVLGDPESKAVSCPHWQSQKIAANG